MTASLPVNFIPEETFLVDIQNADWRAHYHEGIAMGLGELKARQYADAKTARPSTRGTP